MTLKDQLMKDLQDAMRSGDDLRKETLRMARSSVKNAEMMRSAEILDMVSRNDPAARGELFDRIRHHRKLAQEYDDTGQVELAQKERDRIAELVAQNTDFDDAKVQDVLRKEIKQRRESAEEYEKGKRMDLADRERAEVSILEVYLPAQMSEDEIETEVRAILAETDAREMSKIMPQAMARMKGKADGRLVNRVVTRVLSES
jgi:uncharacterized protein